MPAITVGMHGATRLHMTANAITTGAPAILPAPRTRRGVVVRVAALLTIAVAGVMAVTVMRGGANWSRDSDALTKAVRTSAASTPLTAVSFAQLEGLPAPVQRYLRLVLREGQPAVSLARMHQVGSLRTGVEADQWMAFEADETVAPGARSLLWDARIQLMPLTHVMMRDSYLSGVAEGEARLQSAITIKHERGGHQLNSGTLYRLLAEAPWFPTMLLPRAGLTWEAVDEHRARATLAEGNERVTVEFRFNEAGEIAVVFAEARPRLYGTGFVDTPWEGHFSNYVEAGGMRVPSAGEVGWIIEDRWFPVWKGTASGFEFN
jgi:hypothetical protein